MKTTHSLSLKFNKLTPVSRMVVIFAILWSPVLLLVTSLAGIQLHHTAESQAASFGKTLAKQTADSATELLVTDDRVSMNVLLSRLLENPYIARATIYGVDGEVLARAQANNKRPLSDQVFSAPIHYQEVIAGYVRITLNKNYTEQPASDSTELIILCAALGFIIGLLIIFRFGSNILRIKPPMPEPVPTPTPEPEAPNQNIELPPVEKKVDPNNTVIAIYCQNIQKLSRCLNPREVQDLLDSQLQALQAGVELYNGTLSFNAEGSGYVVFSAEEHSDYQFRVICCAVLLRDLLKEVAVPAPTRFHFGFGIALADHERPLWQGTEHPALADSACSEALTLAMHAEPDAIAASPLLLSQLEEGVIDQLDSTDQDGCVDIQGLKGHCDQVIIKQMNQLLDRIEETEEDSN